MFVNDRRDNWNKLLPFVMHAYRTSVHESNGYSPFRFMMGEECSLPQDVSTDELRTNREQDVAPHPFATWVRHTLEVAYVAYVRYCDKETLNSNKQTNKHTITCASHYNARPLCGDRSARLLFCYEMRSSGPPFWLFLQSRGTTCWIRMLAILAWVEYSARSRMIRSGSLLIAAVLSGHLSVNTAPQNERCWQRSPCVYSFVPIYAALGSSYERITSLLFGFTGLRIPRV